MHAHPGDCTPVNADVGSLYGSVRKHALYK